MKTPTEIIDQLGGTVAAAKKLGVSQQVVTNWKARGRIPYKYAFMVVKASKRTVKMTDFFGDAA